MVAKRQIATPAAKRPTAMVSGRRGAVLASQPPKNAAGSPPSASPATVVPIWPQSISSPQKPRAKLIVSARNTTRLTMNSEKLVEPMA